MTYPEPPPEERVDALGLVGLGEVTTRVQREAITEPDFRNVWVAGQVESLEAVRAFANEVLASSRPYDDVRAIRTMLIWISDRVREVQTPSYGGDPDGHQR
jgi:hypothetical protein